MKYAIGSDNTSFACHKTYNKRVPPDKRVFSPLVNALTRDELEAASVLAQQLLEAGLAFEKHLPWQKRVQRATGRAFREPAYKNPSLAIYDPEQIRELNMQPTPLLQEQIRAMLLAKHEEHQARRAAGKTPAQEFYAGKAWQALRYSVLAERGNRCECCGATPADGARMHVDHIKPRSRYPELALDRKNLQVLCDQCNMGKSNRHEDDWRKHKRVLVKK